MPENLAGRSLIGADLRGRDLAKGDHRGADLTEADFRGADLTDADLSGADLSRADLRQAILTRTSFQGATLHRTKIEVMHASVLGAYEGTPDFRQNGERDADDDRAQRWRVKDVDVRCPLCAHEEHFVRSGRTVGAGAQVTMLECARCSHLLWLAATPVPVRPALAYR